MHYEYKTKGTCSSRMIFEIEGNTIMSLEVIGGCPGNLAGISKMVKGMTLDHVIEVFEGTTCGRKSTSCPDQIAQALKQYKEQYNV